MFTVIRHLQSPMENGLEQRCLAGSPLTRKGTGGGCIVEFTYQIMATRRRCILKGAFLMAGYPCKYMLESPSDGTMARSGGMETSCRSIS